MIASSSFIDNARLLACFSHTLVFIFLCRFFSQKHLLRRISTDVALSQRKNGVIYVDFLKIPLDGTKAQISQIFTRIGNIIVCCQSATQKDIDNHKRYLMLIRIGYKRVQALADISRSALLSWQRNPCTDCKSAQ